MKFKRIDSKMSDLSSSHDSRSHHSVVVPMTKTKGGHEQKDRDHKAYKEEKSMLSQRLERPSTSRFDHFHDVDDSEDYRKFNQITGGRVSITSSILSSETPMPMDCASLHLTYKQLPSNSTGKGSHLETKDDSDYDEEEVLSLGVRGISSGLSGREMQFQDEMHSSHRDNHEHDALGSFNEEDEVQFPGVMFFQ